MVSEMQRPDCLTSRNRVGAGWEGQCVSDARRTELTDAPEVEVGGQSGGHPAYRRPKNSLLSWSPTTVTGPLRSWPLRPDRLVVMTTELLATDSNSPTREQRKNSADTI